MMQAGTQVGSYRVDNLLGQGGMAEVYKAWNLGLHRYEALKLLPPQMTYDRSFVERFLTEARTAANLHHSHIVTIHTISEATEAQPYFTMELVEGGDLAHRISHLGCFSVNEALPILRQIGEGLDYAHAHGIIHRDVKPANVLLQPTGQGGWNVKVVDFGIARAQEPGNGSRLTKTGMIVGTPEYMSPEQGGSGARVDHRTDIYSLGVIAYEMLCGHPPFAAGTDGSAISVIMSHIRDLPKPLAEQIPQIPTVVNDAILRALAKDPERRFESCADLTNALSGAVIVSRLESLLDMAPHSIGNKTASQSTPARNWAIPALIAIVLLGGGMIAAGVARENHFEVLAGSPKVTVPIPILLVQVPKLIGKTEDQARALASASSLEVNVTTDHSASVPAGTIISQDTPPDSSVQLAAKINILVSTGPSLNVSAVHTSSVSVPSPMLPSTSSALSKQASHRNASSEASEQELSKLRERYDEWLRTWRRMDLSAYLSFYSPDVIERRAGKSSYGYAELRQKLADNWAKQTYISVDSQVPDIHLEGNTATMSVFQHYDSTTWWDEGIKSLVWVRENGDWVIHGEAFSKQGGGSK